MKSLSVTLLILVSFTCGYVFGCENNPILAIAQQTVQEVVPGPYMQNPDEVQISYADELKDERTVTVVFTLDDNNKIHVLHISGGYNLVTQYIKTSLEGKEIHSDSTIPGINYVMTIKLPASV
ncbi:MAG: hypothetical protein H7Y00_13700 [Fimbriimonadaceae bacterium]|nr:hypothetical protein [Chitinophagales bacterium]